MTFKKKSVTLLAILSLLTLTLPVPTFAKGSGRNPDCREIKLDVALQQGQPSDQKIAGTLCKPGGRNAKAVDILVHGATYNRSYWDFSKRYPYSYVRQAMHSKSGRATFNYDRLATGKSSRPASADVTMDADAYVLHQIIQWFKNKKHFSEINVVGHSFGSMIAVREAAYYNDADRLVLTGSLFGTGPALINGEIVTHPANEDPMFAGKGYDEGYRTTVPDGKDPFYYLPAANPSIIARDNATKDVISGTQFVQGQQQRMAPADSNLAKDVRVPVFLIAGQQDRLYCGVDLDCTNMAAVRDLHAPYYPNVPKLDIVTIPDTGHNLTLHPSAGTSFKAIDHWLRNN
jgi:pimeloyl-ACP methyl ester carboxylesterase